MYSIQLQKEKKRNQPKVNTVQFWSKTYFCSFFFYDDYFTLFGCPEFPWEIRIRFL